MKKMALLVVMAAVLGIGAISFAAEMEERDSIYLYDEYKFEFSSRHGGAILALTFVVPGKEIKEKGPAGVLLDVVRGVIERYKLSDKEKGVDAYIITIVSYLYIDRDSPENNIPALMLSEELDMKEIEGEAEKPSEKPALPVNTRKKDVVI